MLALLLCVPQLPSCAAEAPKPLPTGAGVFPYEHDPGDREAARALEVHFFKPESASEQTPVWYVMHGMKRNAAAYRDQWLDVAREAGVYLLVPRFSEEDFPASRGYNLGNMFDEFGRPNDPSRWSFSVIEAVFTHLREREGLTTPSYSIFGHSAGAQFVHRMVLFQPRARIHRAVAANAGWYTMPTSDAAYPYGLAGTTAGQPELARAFSAPLVLILGDQDTDPEHPHLRKTPEAMEQGPHRFARGQHFFASAQAASARMGVPLKWSVVVAPGVGHSNTEVVPWAARLLREPAPDQPAG